MTEQFFLNACYFFLIVCFAGGSAFVFAEAYNSYCAAKLKLAKAKWIDKKAAKEVPSDE